MKHLITLLAFVVSVTAGAQSSSWDPDYNGDGVIGTTDLLGLLSVFGLDEDGDGIWSGADLCTDIGACNFQANPTEECLYLDATGECGGYCEEDVDGDGVCDWTCGFDSIVYHNVTYHTLQLGNKCWFKTNLMTDTYNNGDTIVSGLSDSFWASSSTGAFSIPLVEYESLSAFGYLYNNKAIQDPRGLCPNGWHVSNDTDWMSLEVFLGMDSEQAEDFGWRGTTQGSELKSGVNDEPAWNGTNNHGFGAVPSGYRNDNNGTASHLFAGAYFWTSSPYSTLYWFRHLSSSEGIYRYWSGENAGMSVRCVKD